MINETSLNGNDLNCETDIEKMYDKSRSVVQQLKTVRIECFDLCSLNCKEKSREYLLTFRSTIERC